MLPGPDHPEIDHRTMKLIVGVIALSLANLTSWFARTPPLTSISESYHRGGLAQVIFIGFLFAIAAFLLAYNGYTRWQMVASKVAAVASLFVAVFPCDCNGHDQRVPYLHGISAAVTFAILAFFCYVFFQRAVSKGSMQAKSRAFIYAICGVVIVVAVVVLGVDELFDQLISRKISRLTYYGEKAALVAFGVSWLTASHWLPFITTKRERLERANPDNSENAFPEESRKTA